MIKNARKKVLFLITDLAGGGAERVLVNLVNNLDKTKFDVTVQTIFDVGINRKHLNETVKYIGGFKKQFRGNVALMRIFSPKLLYKLFIREKYDVLISFLEGPPARIISGCEERNVRKVAWVHVEHDNTEQLAYAFGSKIRTEQAYNSMDRIICVADTVKKNFLSLLDISVPVETLYNVNESERIRELSKDSIENIFDASCKNIISVGRLIEMKGYDRLIRVHKRLLDCGIAHRMFVLGEGEKRSSLEKQIVEENVQETFYLLGFSENPYKYIAKSDLFICSSKREGFSTAVTEALILGIPVVSTEVSGAYELLGLNNEYGVVTLNNEDDLYEGIKSLLEDPVMLEYYKKQANYRGCFFNKEERTKAVERMIGELLGE